MKQEYLLLDNNICLSVLAFFEFLNVNNFMAQQKKALYSDYKWFKIVWAPYFSLISLTEWKADKVAMFSMYKWV